MSYGIQLHVWGDYACFTRPEMKVERVSYDIITPSAARGILEAIHWKPAIHWVIDRIHPLKPIRFETLRRNEVSDKISARNITSAINNNTTNGLYMLADEKRQQRATTLLRDVAYLIDAHFELTDKATAEDTPGKHLDQFNRRARKGQCFHQPCLGTRELPAYFCLVEPNEPAPQSELPQSEHNRSFGWMLHDIDFAKDNTPYFFHATLQDGVLHIPPPSSDGVKA